MAGGRTGFSAQLCVKEEVEGGGGGGPLCCVSWRRELSPEPALCFFLPFLASDAFPHSRQDQLVELLFRVILSCITFFFSGLFMRSAVFVCAL